MDMSQALTTEQAAERLGCTPGHVRKLVERGDLAPSHRFPRRLLLFDAATLDAYAAHRRPRGRPRKPLQPAE